MTKPYLTSPLAMTAMAAVLAAAPTLALAQEAPLAEPVAAPAAAPDPAPIAVTPAATPTPIMQSTPVIQAAPVVVPEPTPVVAAEPAPAPRRAARAAAVPAAPAASPIADQPVAAAAAPATPAPVVVAIEPPTAIAPEPEFAAAPPAEPANNSALALGLLGLAGLGGAGALALRRRKRVPAETTRADAPASLERRMPHTAVTAQATPAAAYVPPLARTEPEALRRVWSEPLVTARAAPGVSGSAISPGPLPTGEAMAALMARMAHAAPDEANPYTSPKRRSKRVRWLLKQHEYALRNAASEPVEAAKPFDFRRFASSNGAAPGAGQFGRTVVPA